MGYTVYRNLFITEQGKQCAQVDVLASVQTPLREDRIIVECKGGEPSFNELKEFSCLVDLITPPPDELVMVCKDSTGQDRYKVADRLGVSLVARSSLVGFLLPILGFQGAKLIRQEKVRAVNRLLAAYAVEDYLLRWVASDPDLKAYARFLNSELWLTADPAVQAQESYDKATSAYADMAERIATKNGTSARSELANPVDDRVQTAMYLQSLHRVLGMYAVVRLAIEARRRLSAEDYLRMPGNLRNVLVQIAANPRAIFAFPSFMQHWLMVWGGVVYKPMRQYEIWQLSVECGTALEAVEF